MVGVGRESPCGQPPATEYEPLSVSDILYLIATCQDDSPDLAILEKLDQANLSFLRGDPQAALSLVDAALAGIDPRQRMHSDVVATRLFLLAMLGQDGERVSGTAARIEAIEDLTVASGAPGIVAMCVESERHWHSGSLFYGLCLNRFALQHSQKSAIIWRLNANVLLTMKLLDLHVSRQALRIMQEIQEIIDSCGLQALGALPHALRSTLHLQQGRLNEAIECASVARSLCRLQASTLGLKDSLSVMALAHLRLGQPEQAAAALREFAAPPHYYVMTGALARATFTEIALVAGERGPHAAAELVRERWRRLGTRSACFAEDIDRPAWLVSLARQAGDAHLAERVVDAIEQLAARNPGISVLDAAAHRADAALTRREPFLPTLALAESAGIRSTTAPDTREIARPAQCVVGQHTAPAPPRSSSLSKRENEVARLVIRGMTNQQIARQLALSPHTVNFHLRKIFRKLSISTRAQLGTIMAQKD